MDQDELREGKSRVDVFEALTPICGHYTVCDAFLVWRMLRAAENASLYSEDMGALHEAASLIETFVAHGWPSGADCVTARASALRIDEDGERSMDDVNDDAARAGLSRDVWYLRSGRYHGDRFDRGEESHPSSNGLPLWLDRALASLKQGNAA
jgi:hypothetical protein